LDFKEADYATAVAFRLLFRPGLFTAAALEVSPVDNNVRKATTSGMLDRVPVIGAVLLASFAAPAQTYIFGRAEFAVGNFPTSIVSGDFNGDGLTDLASTNSGDNTISVLLAKGDVTFCPASYLRD
jgi:hypothetical protein